MDDMFQGRTVWRGEVEVFDLTGHPRAKRCYAWIHREEKNDAGERIVAVLEIPPVVSAETAVWVQIVKDGKGITKRALDELSKTPPPSN